MAEAAKRSRPRKGEPPRSEVPASESHAEGGQVCTVGFCPICLAVTAVQPLEAGGGRAPSQRGTGVPPRDDGGHGRAGRRDRAGRRSRRRSRGSTSSERPAGGWDRHRRHEDRRAPDLGGGRDPREHRAPDALDRSDRGDACHRGGGRRGHGRRCGGDRRGDGRPHRHPLGHAPVDAEPRLAQPPDRRRTGGDVRTTRDGEQRRDRRCVGRESARRLPRTRGFAVRRRRHRDRRWDRRAAAGSSEVPTASRGRSAT